MPGYEVVIDALRAAARGAHGAADELRAVDPAFALRVGASALPGARAIDKIGSVQQMWQGRGETLSGEFDTHGDRLSTAVELYERSEQTAAEHLEAPQPSTGPMRPM